MSADEATVEITWGGDERAFRLGIAELIALQDKRDSGPTEILERLFQNRWRVEDLQEIVRLGLIGAKVEGRKARELVEQHVTEGRLLESVLVAQAILAAAVQGRPGDPVGKAGADAENPETAVSPQPPSTDRVQ